MIKKHKQIKVGDVLPTNDGGSVTIVDYINSRKVLVEHNDSHKYRVVVSATNLQRGQVKNPFKPSVYGLGFIGVGVYPSSIYSKHTPAYDSWRNMLKRCYSKVYHSSRPKYVGCHVSLEWLNFQTFAKWFYGQANSQTKGFALDKDLLVLGNTVYSEETCSFVPQEINNLLNDHGAASGDLPQGVTVNKKSYLAQLSDRGKNVYLGLHSTPELAHTAYKRAKEDNVKYMAVEWREWLHPTVYSNLMKWELPP